MKRIIEQDLKKWLNSNPRLPLLIRGARQVGKTYIIEKFAKQQLNNYLTINFELEPEFKNCFKSLKPTEIINLIEGLSGKTITSRTLLFFDEIQEHPPALQSLRYFKEQMPEIPIIAAGSLLEFALTNEKFRMPVGRIAMQNLRPMSFKEYLLATNDKLIDHIEKSTFKNPLPEVLHNKLNNLINEYITIGGMPAVISQYLSNQNFQSCQQVQTNILNTYRADFSRYGNNNEVLNIQMVFDQSPTFISKCVKYSKISMDVKSKDIKSAINKLGNAKIINKIYSSQASGLPLIATVNYKKYKLLFLDIGLVNRMLRLGINLLLNDIPNISDISLLNKGQITEQFVGQELLCLFPHEEPDVFFWSREAKNSQAEVDYITSHNGNLLPIEVKSGSSGKLKSLKNFLIEKKIDFGWQVSKAPLAIDKNIIKIPLYMISEIPRIFNLII